MKFLNTEIFAYNCTVISTAKSDTAEFSLFNTSISSNSPSSLSISDLAVSLALGFIIAIFYADTIRENIRIYLLQRTRQSGL